MNVSIIIPSFNRKASTKRAVESVLAQTNREFEVLVIDDCSRAEEVYEPDAAFSAQVRVIQHPANAGVSAARNTGLQAAKGPLIAFLDSDDYWLPERLERHVKLLLGADNRERTLLYGAYYTVEDRFRIATPLSAIKPNQAVGDYVFLDYGCLHVNTWLAEKSFLELVPFDPRLKQSEDWDVLLRMEALGGRFLYDPVPCAVRHVDLREDRLSTRTDVECQWRFLEMNSERLTPRARAIFESITREQESPSKNAWRGMLARFAFFMRVESLTVWQRLMLLVDYTRARVLNRIGVKLHRSPAT